MSEGDRITTRYSGEVRFDYYQFYIGDSASNPDAVLATAWDNPEALARRLAVGPDFIIVLAEDVGAAQVDVAVHDRRPHDDTTEWEYVAEASVALPSGHLVIDGYPPAADFDAPPPLAVRPGMYRVRICHDFLRGEEVDEQDRYRIAAWPAALDEVRVLRHNNSWH